MDMHKLDARRKRQAAQKRRARRSVSLRIQHYETAGRARGGESMSAYLERLIEQDVAASGLSMSTREEASARLNGPQTPEQIERERIKAFG